MHLNLSEIYTELGWVNTLIPVKPKPNICEGRKDNQRKEEEHFQDPLGELDIIIFQFIKFLVMPFKYIGRTTDFKGKTLWEILGNLRNYGVGRIVCRSRFERYPEPSYYKILKVETLANPVNPTIDDVRKVRVTVEKTFRGKTFPKPVLIESASYKTDYRLIPKDEEADYCKKLDFKQKILPKYMELPPLLNQLLLQEMKAKGENINESPMIEIKYTKQIDNKYRKAEEGEKPDVEMTVGLGTPISPNLYKGV